MKTSQLKPRMMAVLAAIMLCVATISAQSVKKHVVERGETLASIAEKYGISQDDLARLNPDAAQFVYVGMELTLPESTQPAVPKADNATVNAEPTERPKGNAIIGYAGTTGENASTTQGEETHNTGDTELAAELVLSYQNFTGEGGKWCSWGFGMTWAFGSRYYISEKVFLEGLIGYKLRAATYKKSYARVLIQKDYASGNFTSHSIYVPIRIGINVNKLLIKAGPYFDYIVYGKNEISSGKDKIKGKVKDDRFSAGLSLSAAYKKVTLSFGLGLTDFAGTDKCKEMSIGLGWTL